MFSCKIHLDENACTNGISWNSPIKIFTFSQLVLPKQNTICSRMIIAFFLESMTECFVVPKFPFPSSKKGSRLLNINKVY